MLQPPLKNEQSLLLILWQHEGLEHKQSQTTGMDTYLENPFQHGNCQPIFI